MKLSWIRGSSRSVDLYGANSQTPHERSHHRSFVRFSARAALMGKSAVGVIGHGEGEEVPDTFRVTFVRSYVSPSAPASADRSQVVSPSPSC